MDENLSQIQLDESQNTPTDNFKRKQIFHMKAELFETRINDGLDLSRTHPAEAVTAATKAKSIKMNDDERGRYENYEEKLQNQMIPRFWEKRVWDTDENIMSDENTLKTQRRIEELLTIAQPDEFTFTNVQESDLICPPTNTIREKRNRVVVLSLNDHFTDESETDIEIC